jgi:hypothetical protein
MDGKDLAQEWQTRLARFATSGLSVRKFCTREKISDKSFYYWRKRLAAPAGRAKSPSVAFFEIGESRRREHPIELVMPGGITVRVPAGCDKQTLVRVLEALADR